MSLRQTSIGRPRRTLRTKFGAERGAIAVKHDVSLEPDWQAAVDAAVSEFGRVDVLVNNAGVGPSKPLLETSLEDWHAVMRVNLDGVSWNPDWSGSDAGHAIAAAPRTGIHHQSVVNSGPGRNGGDSSL